MRATSVDIVLPIVVFIRLGVQHHGLEVVVEHLWIIFSETSVEAVVIIIIVLQQTPLLSGIRNRWARQRNISKCP